MKNRGIVLLQKNEKILKGDWMKKELILLREYMKRNELDAYIIPSSDAHQGEYVADHFQGRKWVSGFTGSAGTAVILREKAGVWTDGRYFIQAQRQLEGSGFDLFKMAVEGVPTYGEWLASELVEGAKVGFDGRVICQNDFQGIDKELKGKDVHYHIKEDALSEIWEERPELSKDKIFDFDVKFAGASREERVEAVREELRRKKAQMYLISSLDDIAWLLNLRGQDVKNTPLFYSYVVVEEKKVVLFIDGEKVDTKLSEILTGSNIDVMPYEEIGNYLDMNTKGKTIICDPSKTSRYAYSFLENGSVIEQQDMTTKSKALKNEVEREHVRRAYIKDCVALTKFFNYIEKNVEKGITELGAESVLEGFRREDSSFIYNSFDPIAGYRDHAAMMHFKATEENTYTLERKGFFLVDSGGQYLDGTTDITRTLVMGDLTHEEKFDFTIALQGVIELSTTKFLKGTSGYALDTICRKPMWNQGIDYKCGTGHGIGFFLNIHEGPCGFGPRPTYNTPLLEGMLVTIEPGVYKENRHGIRHENSVFVQKSMESEFGEFLELETITYFPIDTRAILVDELSSFQRKWLNDYHKKTYEILSSYLTGDDLEWLEERTKEI